MEKSNGCYKRLVESQKRKNDVSVAAIKKDNLPTLDQDDENIDFEKEAEEESPKAFNKFDARKFAPCTAWD